MQQKSDNVVSHYVFEAPVRIWHWLTVLCMAVLMVTGYFIGKPLPSVSGEATYLFYMGYIRLIHFSAGMIFTVVLLMRIYWAFVGNRYSRELFIDDTVISTMVNGYRSHKFGKISNKERS